MTRIVRDDFIQLKDYCDKYSLAPLAKDPQYPVLMSLCHKKYYSHLLFLSELINNGYSHIASLHNLGQQDTDKLVNYTKESVSDLGSAFFSWIHGSYKASRLLIRSSIENLIRGIGAIDNPTICESTKGHEIFDKASSLPLFGVGQAGQYLQWLRGDYKILCADVHTAGISHMQHLSALEHFPAFDFAGAEQTAKLFSRVAQRSLSLLCICLREVLFEMHYSNRDIIISTLAKKGREAVHNP